MDIIGIVLAAVVYTVLGALWYGPIYGEMWKKLVKVKSAKMGPWSMMGSLLLGGLFSVGLWIVTMAFGAETFGAGFMLGIAMAIGFVFPVFMGNIMYEGKSPKLIFIHTAFYILALAVGGGIIAIF